VGYHRVELPLTYQSHKKGFLPKMKRLSAVFAFVCLAHAAFGALTVDPVSLGPANPTDNVAFSYAGAARGGTPPYIWHITRGVLPTGLLIWPNGNMAGVIAAAGTFDYDLEVTDAAGATAKATMTFTVVAPPILSWDNVNFLFRNRTGVYVSRVAVIAAALEDWQTTEQCVRLPGGVCVEKNQILLAAGINPATAIGSRRLLTLKIALPTAMIVGQELYRRWHPLSDKQVIRNNWIVAIGQGALDAHNRATTEKLEHAQ
jgi:hypothetical protein